MQTTRSDRVAAEPLATSLRDVVLCECFARDGLQHEQQFVPTRVKADLIDQFARLGFVRIEATSYARPAVIPQFRDTSELLKILPRRAGVSYKATCPNVRAVERALADRADGHGVDEISLLVSASEAHSTRNLRRNRHEQWAIVSEMAAAVRGQFRFVGTISVAFGCPFEGYVDPDRVVSDVAKFVERGVTHVTLADTVGMATPKTVRAMFDRVTREFPETIAVAHFHDSRGTGLVNYVAALDAGVRHFDSAFGGVGGHPAHVTYGSGFTGNVCTEDWVDLLESLGVRTGIDIGNLLGVARDCERVLGRQLLGHVTRTGRNPLPASAQSLLTMPRRAEG